MLVYLNKICKEFKPDKKFWSSISPSKIFRGSFFFFKSIHAQYANLLKRLSAKFMITL